jgi:hypothetical protein
MARLQILLGTYKLYDTDWITVAPAPALRAVISGIGGQGWKWEVETVEPIRGVEIKTIDRGLASTDLKFTVCTEYTDHAAAVLALMTGPLNIQRGGLVQIIAAPDTGPSTTFYLTQGVLESVSEPSIIGCRIWQSYSLIGGRWTTNKALV